MTSQAKRLRQKLTAALRAAGSDIKISVRTNVHLIRDQRSGVRYREYGDAESNVFRVPSGFDEVQAAREMDAVVYRVAGGEGRADLVWFSSQYSKGGRVVNLS